MRNVPITTKFLIALLLMAVTAIGIGLYAVNALWWTSTAYSDLLEHESQAAVAFARANRGAGDLNGLLYKLVAQPDSTQDRAIAAEIEVTKTFFEGQIAAAAAVLPQRAEQIDAILAAYRAMLAEYATAEDDALHDRNAEAVTRMRAKVDPAMKAFRQSLIIINGENSQAVKSRSDGLTAESRQTYDVTLGIAIGASLLVLLLVYRLAQMGISRPIEALVALMGRLATGDTGIVVNEQDRLDEVGAMARALHVFKNAALEKARLDDLEKQRLERERETVEAQRQREQAVGHEIAALIQSVAHGDLASRLDLSGKDGFYRSMSEGINHLTDTIETSITDIARVMKALAEGDLSQRITKDYQGAFNGLKNDINTTSARLTEIVGQIGDATQRISTAAAEVSAGAADLSERTEEQASSLEETAASMEALSATVQAGADNGARASAMAGNAQKAAEQGGVVAGAAIDAMKEIAQASRKITDIIGVIDEIAFQTNLLALNAAVEAARAGDAGKGFAVVAQEVRVLAQRSAQASKEIKALILSSDNQVQNGVELVQKAGDSLGGIAQGIHQVAALITEIAAASQRQASALGEINAAVASMDEMTQKNAALVEETSAAAQSMTGQAVTLRDMVAFFKIEDAQAQAQARRPVGPVVTSRKPTAVRHVTIEAKGSRRPSAVRPSGLDGDSSRLPSDAGRAHPRPPKVTRGLRVHEDAGPPSRPDTGDVSVSGLAGIRPTGKPPSSGDKAVTRTASAPLKRAHTAFDDDEWKEF